MRVLINDCLLANFQEGLEYEVFWDNEDNPYIKSQLDEGEYTLNDLAYYHVYFELVKEKAP